MFHIIQQIIGVSLAALTEDKVFIVHCNGKYVLYGFICTINEAVVTPSGRYYSLYKTASYSNYNGTISAVALTENKVFIFHVDNSTNLCLYGFVCTIDGTTIITIGTDTAINSLTKGTGYAISAVALSKNEIFIAHSYDINNNYLYGITYNNSVHQLEAVSDEIKGISQMTGTENETVQVKVPNI